MQTRRVKRVNQNLNMLRDPKEIFAITLFVGY